MGKLIIFLIIFIGPMILKAIKKNNEKTSSKKMFSPDIEESSPPLKNFFDLFEDKENENLKAKEKEEEEEFIETEKSKKVEQNFYSEIIDDNFEEKNIIKQPQIKSRETSNTLHKFDRYSYLKKAMIYKEIFDQPVSMRNH